MTLADKIALNDRIITLAEARIYFNGCIPGWKLMCKLHNISYKEIVLNGILASKLLSLNDAMVNGFLTWVYSDGR